MDIELDFEYAIFNEENLTKIASEGFEIDAPNYSSLIFKDENDLSNYSLKVNFPGRTPFLLSSLISVILTSVIFTSIIIIAYITTILLLLRQRQISQIKTDFELYGSWKGFGMVHNIHMGYGSDLPARKTNFGKVILSSVYQI